MVETILQHEIFTRFAFPFLLVFFIVFALLEKTKILGDGKKQLDALVAFIIALIFVGVAYPTQVISNMVLFLTVAVVVLFVGLLLWGFVAEGGNINITNAGVKWALGIVITVGVVAAVVWATGFDDPFSEWLFKQNWSGPFWTNLLFIVVIAVALAVIWKSASSGGSS